MANAFIEEGVQKGFIFEILHFFGEVRSSVFTEQKNSYTLKLFILNWISNCRKLPLVACSPRDHVSRPSPLYLAKVDLRGLSIGYLIFIGNTLVHCHFGVSRSATLVIAYLMEKYRLSYEQAHAYVKQRRNFINPNPGFVNQLREYQRLNYDVNGFHRFEAFMNVNARKHKYKIASMAAVAVGILVPIVVLIG